MSTLSRRRLWASLCLMAVVCSIAAYHLLLAHLDSPLVKGAINRYLREHAGIEIDYERLELSPLAGRLVVEGLRVLSPPPYREHAPLFLELNRLAARWSTASLMGQVLLVQEVRIAGLALHWVQDAEGHTTLDFFRTGEAPPPESAPLSQVLQLADWPRPLHVETLALADLVLTWRELDEHRAVLRQGALEGLEAVARLGLVPGEAAADLKIRSPSRFQGTRLTYRDSSVGDAREADLRLDLDLRMANSRTLNLELGADLLRQSFAETFAPSGRLLEVKATAVFNAEARVSRFTLHRLAVLEELARAEFSALIPDTGGFPIVESGAGSFHLDPILTSWPGLIPGVDGKGVRLHYQLRPEAAAGEAAFRLKVRGQAERLAVNAGRRSAEVQGLSLHVDGTGISPRHAAFSLRLPVESLRLRDGDAYEARFTAVDIASEIADLAFCRENPFLSTGQITAAVDIAAAQARLESTEIALQGAALRAESALEGMQRFAPKVSLPVEQMAVQFADGGRLAAKRLAVNLRLEDITPSWSRPVGVAAASGFRELTLALPRRRLEMDRGELGVRAMVFPEGRASGRGWVPFTGLRLAHEGEALETVADSGQFRWSLPRLVWSGDSWLPAEARLEVDGLIDTLSLGGEAEIRDHQAETRFALETPALGKLAHLVPPAVRRESGVAWTQVGFSGHGRGRYRHLERPEALAFDQELEMRLQDLALHRPELHGTLPALIFRAQHRGEVRDHRLAVDIELDRPRFNEGAYAGLLRLSARAEAAASSPRARLALQIEGPQGPDMDAVFEGEIDAATGVLHHQASFHASRAGGVEALFPPALREAYPIDWERLSVSLRSAGEIAGLIKLENGDLFPSLVEGARDTLVAQQQLEVDLRGIGYAAEGLAVQLPQVHLTASGGKRAGRLAGVAVVAVPQAEIQNGSTAVVLEDMSHRFRFSAASRLAEGDLEIHLDSRLAAAQQSILPFYPIRDVTLSGRLHLDRLAALEVDEFVLANPAGGTRLELSKSLNRAPRGGELSAADPLPPVPPGSGSPSLHKLSFRGRLSQALEALNGAPEVFQGKGTLVAPLTLYSTDGMLFDIAASLRLNDVVVRLPEEGLEIQGANGNILLEETVEWDSERGLSVVPHSTRNTFARVRFQDVQPFLSRQSFLSIDRVAWRDIVAGPIVGSLQIKRNVFAVNKLKIQKGKGAISGQLVLDYLPGAERIKFRGNATGLRLGSRGERLDGNLALVFLPSSLELNGRVQILRLSRQHLLDLLDLLDPFREDGSLNRLRRILAFGHPSFVRIEMSQGLMSLKVDLGGMAALIKMDAIRGVALGPFMHRHIAPLLP